MILNFIQWNPSPEIFQIPGIDWPVRWYGLLWAVAFLSSFYVMSKIYMAEGRTNKDLDTLTLYMVLGTIIGARLGHCLFYGPWFGPEGYLSNPWKILYVWEGGLASHGGAIGIIVSMVLYCRKTGESWRWLFDRIVVVVPMAGMFIRIGNLINGEIVGNVTNVPWAFVFLNNDEDRHNYADYGTPFPPRHPAQLYEAIFCLFLFIFLYWFWKNKRNTVGPGWMFGFFCIVLWSERFLDEFLKVSQSPFEDELPLNMGQILSIPFIAFGIWMMISSKKLKHQPLQENPDQTVTNHSA